MTIDRIETARESVAECNRLIREILDEHNCSLVYYKNIGEIVIESDDDYPSCASEILDQ